MCVPNDVSFVFFKRVIIKQKVENESKFIPINPTLSVTHIED